MSEVALKLYFVMGHTCDGENMDLLVFASSSFQAWKFWIDYYDFEIDEVPKYIYEVPFALPNLGAVVWGDLNFTDCASLKERFLLEYSK